jgi:hypothetical protein
VYVARQEVKKCNPDFTLVVPFMDEMPAVPSICINKVTVLLKSHSMCNVAKTHLVRPSTTTRYVESDLVVNGSLLPFILPEPEHARSRC